jgi:nitrous oxide reductase accessory protein NosL
MALANHTDVFMAMTADFLYGTMLNALHAWYVVNSDVSLCCSPSVISFSRRDDAERFKQGFTGEIMDFDCAQDKIRQMMEL